MPVIGRFMTGALSAATECQRETFRSSSKGLYFPPWSKSDEREPPKVMAVPAIACAAIAEGP